MTIPSIKDVAVQINNNKKIIKTVGGAGTEGRIIDSTNLPTANLPAAFVVLYDSDADDNQLSNGVYQVVNWTFRIYSVVDASTDPTGLAAANVTIDQVFYDLTKNCLYNWQPYAAMTSPVSFKGHGIESQSGSRLVYYFDFLFPMIMSGDDGITYSSATLDPVINFQYDNTTFKSINVNTDLNTN